MVLEEPRSLGRRDSQQRPRRSTSGTLKGGDPVLQGEAACFTAIDGEHVEVGTGVSMATSRAAVVDAVVVGRERVMDRS
jgi:hypothetical protein